MTKEKIKTFHILKYNKNGGLVDIIVLPYDSLFNKDGSISPYPSAFINNALLSGQEIIIVQVD